MSQTLIGTKKTVFVEKKDNNGYILSYGNSSLFLPRDETDAQLDIGDYVNVFIYKNGNEKVIATTFLPNMTVGELGTATVVKIVPRLGMFVSIGMKKDVLLPKDYLPRVRHVWPNIDDKLYITLKLDKQDRLLAVPATERDIESILEPALPETVSLNDEVQGTIYFTSREGSVMLTDQNYRGFIHHTEREREPRLGQHVTGRVIEVKEDGTLNISLLPMKHERIDDDAEKIFNYLKENGGTMPFNDRSQPEDIRATFHMSKSAFKRALGRLMREKKVTQDDFGTSIIEE